jgi:hypothetical protein
MYLSDDEIFNRNLSYITNIIKLQANNLFIFLYKLFIFILIY